VHIALYEESFAARPAFDTAVSHALLRAVDDGQASESLRLHSPGDALAFSVIDRTLPGFPLAVARARAAGFTPIVRLAGGHAAVFERGSLAFAWTVPARDPRSGIRARFSAMALHLERALRKLGVDGRVGEVPGEYCPGEFSVNARGAVKLAGIGQRVLRGAAHVGGVVVVRNSERVRAVLERVYDALELPLDVITVGAVEDELPGVRARDVAQALLAEVAASRPLAVERLPETALELAAELEGRHVAKPTEQSGDCGRSFESRTKIVAGDPSA